MGFLKATWNCDGQVAQKKETFAGVSKKITVGREIENKKRTREKTVVRREKWKFLKTKFFFYWFS